MEAASRKVASPNCHPAGVTHQSKKENISEKSHSHVGIVASHLNAQRVVLLCLVTVSTEKNSLRYSFNERKGF